MPEAGNRISAMLVDAGIDRDGRDVEAHLTATIPGLQLARFRSLADANRSARKQIWFPRLIVVCQSWPDEFLRKDVEQTIGNWPLARLICSFGPWCTSDGRNRSIWPVGTRIPRDQLAHRVRHEYSVLTGEVDPLPVTAGRDESFVFQHQLPPHVGNGLRVITEIADRAIANRVMAGLQSVDYQIANSRTDADVIIWDADCGAAPGSRQPNVALVGIVNSATSNRLRQSGATRIVSKLATDAELSVAILEAVGRAA